MKRDYYEVLGIDKNATEEEIKTAYRKLASMYHPDVSNSPDATEKMAEINEAYATLKNSEKRANYDAYGFSSATTNSSNGTYTYNYNPNSTYYEYNNGFVYRKNYSYFIKILVRMAIIFLFIQGIIFVINLLMSNKANNYNYSYRFTSNDNVQITGLYTSMFSLSNNSITSLVIPSTYTYSNKTYTISSIGEEAFYGYKNLKEITLPNSITSIGSYAFYGCNNLEVVYFDGSEEDFNNILIGNGNSNLKNAKKVFTSKDVEI